jgi:hypothetical protein
MKPAASILKIFYMRLKNHLGVIDHGSLVEFQLTSDEARAWWSQNVEQAQHMQKENSRYVEHRYAGDIYKGMKEFFGT